MTENKTPIIYQKIGKIMKDLSPITKDKKNVQQGFMYRGIDDIYNSLHSIFAENGVFAVPEVLSKKKEERQTKSGGALFYVDLTIKYTFYAEDGSNISCIVEGEAMDSGDKATNKAMSIGYKYALMQILMIPTVEEKDPDGTTQEALTPKKTLPQLEVNTEAFSKVVEALKSGKFTIQDVKKKYELSTDMELHLTDIKL
jgi:hypothetical protein